MGCGCGWIAPFLNVLLFPCIKHRLCQLEFISKICTQSHNCRIIDFCFYHFKNEAGGDRYHLTDMDLRGVYHVSFEPIS